MRSMVDSLGLRRGFLTCAAGEIDKPRCVTYFSTTPKEAVPCQVFLFEIFPMQPPIASDGAILLRQLQVRDIVVAYQNIINSVQLYQDSY